MAQNKLSAASKSVINETSCMAIVFCQGKILSTTEKIYGRPVVSLPKGHVEQGESSIDTATRECYEETDVRISSKEYVCTVESYSYQFDNHHNQTVVKTLIPVVFVTDRCQIPHCKEQAVILARWLDVDEFLLQCSYDNVKTAVGQALESLVSHSR